MLSRTTQKGNTKLDELPLKETCLEQTFCKTLLAIFVKYFIYFEWWDEIANLKCVNIWYD